MSNTNSNSNNQQRGPVVNGLTLEVSDSGRSGFYGVSQRFTGGDAIYFTQIPVETVRAHGGNPADWPKSQGGGLHLGHYSDARVAAYVKAYWAAHPVELINRFNAITVTPGGTTRRHKVEHEGALLPQIPAELYAVPNDFAELMRNYPAPERGRRETVKVTVPGNMTAWNKLLKDNGVTGQAVADALGGDVAFVLGLRTLSYEAAEARLASRGVVLSNLTA